MAEKNGGVQEERSFEIGKDESWFCNNKRLFDELLQESLETQRHMRTHFDKLISDAQQFDNGRQVLANQSLANAVENNNALAKQMIQHRDIATCAIFSIFPESDVFLTVLADKVAGKLGAAK